MKRRHVHFVFAAALAASLAAAALCESAVRRDEAVNRQVLALADEPPARPTTLPSTTAPPPGVPASPSSASPARAEAVRAPGDDVPELRWAHAARAAAAGDIDTAQQLYRPLTLDERAVIRHGAQYNLATAYLATAAESLENRPETAIPMIELGKQLLRDLLREQPDDWDARYNLERALWMAPEPDLPFEDLANPPPPRERRVLRLPGERIELP